MKKFFVCLLTCLLFFSATSQNSLLWKIEGKGAKTSYLFGTFHIFPQNQFSLSDKVIRTLSETEQLVMELALGEGLQAKMMAIANMKDGTTLNDLLTDREMEVLDSALQTTGMSVSYFQRWKPFFITSVFYPQYVEGGIASFELALQKLALEKEMPVLGLETMERQMEIFDQIPYQDQANDLMKMLQSFEVSKKLFDQMVAVYLTEDTEAMVSSIQFELNNAREVELLLDKRNAEWLPVMKKMMKDSSTFFAVGAGHLGGKNGILKLLQKEGFKVTPVFN